MYRVMAVDDEIWVLRGLKKLVPWEKYGFELERAFTNPIDALESFGEQAADVVFVDISMAHMDGLTLIQEMQKKNEQALFVVLSAYSEFEYAKRAISLQVVDYLVKPITEEMLVSMLEKLRQRLESAGKMTERDKLYRWLMQSDSVVTQESLQLLTGIGIEPRMKMAMIARTGGEIPPPERELAFHEFRSPDGLCSFQLWAGEEAGLEREFAEKESMARNGRWILGRSEIVAQVRDCPTALRQAWCGAHHGFMEKTCGLFNGKRNGQAAKEVEMIANLIRNEAWKSAAHSLRRLSDQPLADWSVSDALQLFQKTVIGLNADETLLRPVGSEEALMSAYGSFSDMCMTMAAVVLEKVEDTGAVDMIAVESYIRRHFNLQELSVQFIADIFGVDADYLGRKFREQIGLSIRQSIQDKRLAYARRLLNETDASVQEIARLCGFGDPFYFNKVFKKVYNMTPLQFKKKPNSQ